MEVAEVAEVEPEKKALQRAGKKYTDDTHPYMTPEFWLNPTNQFWNRSSIYKKESYEQRILIACRAELKENLI